MRLSSKKKNKEGCINMFTGFAYKEIQTEDFTRIQPFLNHIKNVLGGTVDTEINYEYIINWATTMSKFLLNYWEFTETQFQNPIQQDAGKENGNLVFFSCQGMIELEDLKRQAIKNEYKLFLIENKYIKKTDFRKVALRLVPYTLTNKIKAKRVDKARIILEILTKMRRDGFIYSVTGAETWIYYRNPANSAWNRKDDEIPTRIAKGIGSPKVIVTVLFSGERVWFAKALDSGLSMNSDRFIELILNPMFQRIKAEFPSDLEPLLHFGIATAHTAAKTTKFI
ncbi:MAG: hypothetical protein EZS28_025973, partial [Streblomastix strix]